MAAPAWATGSGYTYTLAATITPPPNTDVFYAAVDPVTQTVYAADADNDLPVISESTNTVTSTIPVSGGPQTVAVNPTAAPSSAAWTSSPRPRWRRARSSPTP